MDAGTVNRFQKKYIPEPTSGCWLWRAALWKNGYGAFYANGQMTTAHRASYRIHCGDTSPDMEVDHLCRNRGCVNPDHLELVTPATNTHRGIGPAAQNKKKVFCPYGHEYSVENTAIYKDGKRKCRCCMVRHNAKAKANTKRKRIIS